jgi:predicted nucleotidyltransferase
LRLPLGRVYNVGIMTSYKVNQPMILDLLGSRPRLRLLRYLATHEGLQTGRALAHAADVEPKRAGEALADLVEAGLVDRRRAGKAFLYSINRDNYAVAEILLPAFINERDWLKRLGDDIRRSLPAIDSVILYGSWAKGKAQAQSDVDLLLVTRQNVGKSQAIQLQERANDIRARMSERYGRPISLLIVGVENLRRRLRKRDRFIREILAEGQVLAGSGLGEVVAHG